MVPMPFLFSVVVVLSVHMAVTRKPAGRLRLLVAPIVGKKLSSRQREVLSKLKKQK